MSAIGDLKRNLKELRDSLGLESCAVVSRNGIPIAWELPPDIQVETFATLSATILGASEVIYSGLNKESPGKVIVESESGMLVVTGLDSKTLFVAVSSEFDNGVKLRIDEAAKKIKEVLG